MTIFVSTASPSLAQRLLQGRIIDAESEHPLPGATVKAGGTGSTRSDESGRFVLRNVPAGAEVVEVSYVGYETLKVPAGEVQPDRPLRLKRSIYQADEVVVSATRISDRAGMAYSNISAEDIARQNLGADLPVLLNFSPSVVTTSDAGAGVGYTGLRIRGSDASRINVTINGIPYNDPESQGTFFVNMPDFASSVSSIQVQRGVGSSTNGAGAFGATMNINTNEFRREAYAEVNSSYGSFHTFKNTVKVGSGLLHEKFTVDARLSRVSSDGFVDRASSALKSFYLSGGYFGKKSFVRLNVFSGAEKTYQAWNGVPEARLRNDREGMLAYIGNNGLNERDAQHLLASDSRRYNAYLYENETDNYQQDQYQLITSHSLSEGWTLNLNGFYVRGKGYYEQYKDNDKLSKYLLPAVVTGNDTITRTDLVRRRWLDNHFYGTTFSLDYNRFKKLTFNLGGGLNRYEGQHYGEVIWARYASTGDTRHRYYSGQGLKTDMNLYAKAYYQFTGRLNAYGDLQVRQVDYHVDGTDSDLKTLDVDKRMTFLNPKVGLNYLLDEGGSSVYASFSVGNREPNRNDFVDAWPGEQPRHETLQDWEAGLRLQQPAWAFSANAYFMNYKNQLVLTGELNDVGSAIRVNVPESYRLGIELEGAWTISRQLKWNSNLTLSRNKIRNFSAFVFNYDHDGYDVTNHGHSDISFSPGVTGASQLAFLPVKNLELALLTKYVGAQYLDNTSSGDRKLNAYLTNDIRAALSLAPRGVRKLQLSFLLNNLFNELYESNGYTYGYVAGGALIQEKFYFPQAGRNFMVGISFGF